MRTTPNPLKLNIKDDERRRLGQELIERIRQARDQMTPILEKRDEALAFYESDLPPKNYPWPGCSNVNVPITQWHVDTWHAHVNDAILGVSPPVFVKPPPGQAGDPAVRQAAVLVENMLEDVLINVMDLPSSSDEVHQEAFIAGTAIRKLVYSVDMVTGSKLVARELLPDTEPEFEAVEFQTVRYSGPKEKLVNITNFVIYPLTVTDVDEADIVGDRFRLTPDGIKRRIADGDFDREYAEPLLERMGNESSPASDSWEDMQYDRTGIGRVDRDELWFWEVIAGYDYNGDGLKEDCVFVIESETGTIVRAQRFPYEHSRRYYIPMRPFPRPRSFFGRSLYEILAHMQKEINAIHNQRTDAVTLALCKSFKQRRTADTETDTFRMYPGAVALVDSMDDIVEFQISPVVPGIDVETLDRDYCERATASTDIAGGRPSEERKTATEIGAVQANLGVRFGDVIKRVQRPMRELAEQVLGLIRQYSTPDELAAYGVTPEMLQIQWRLVPHGSLVTANKPLQRQEMLMLYQTLINNPLCATNPQRLYNLTAKLLTVFDWDDKEAYIGTDEDVAALVQQQQMMQQQMMQQQMMQQAQPQQPPVDEDREFEKQMALEDLKLRQVETAARVSKLT